VEGFDLTEELISIESTFNSRIIHPRCLLPNLSFRR
jgi:hypothetical protein